MQPTLPSITPRPFFSVCIPTYNRSEKVCRLVRELLGYESESFEVVVLDNRSTDSTVALLGEIQDRRLIVLQNPTNIGGNKNGIEVLLRAQGEFLLYCLDKDFFSSEHLAAFHRSLSDHRDLAAGFCDLHSKGTGRTQVWSAGYPALSHWGFTGQHPSGMVFHTDSLHALGIRKNFSEEEVHSGFFLDFVLAELAARGKVVVFDIPLVQTEQTSDAAKSPSHTYSVTNGSAFFLPARRLAVLCLYLRRLALSELPGHQFRKIAARLYRQQFVNATELYRLICQDAELAAHYGLISRSLGSREFLKIQIWFTLQFLSRRVLSPAERGRLVLGFFGSLLLRGLREHIQDFESKITGRLKTIGRKSSENLEKTVRGWGK